MDPADFQAPEFGHVRRRAGDGAALWYYEPAPLPRDLDLDPATIDALSEADAAVGQLHGLGRLVRAPELLIGPYVRREAVASSRIEGTEASLSDLLQAEAAGGSRADDDVAEVERYVAATYRGLELVRALPLSQRLVCELHAVLLDSVRGANRLPGQFRRSPVWVGSTTDSPDTAVFVPPLPELVPDLFTDWERFVNEPSRRPLVQAALMHYQFETIHPFLDGNGRIGRLLIVLLLVESGRLPAPLLYLSGYLESHRREYYDRLHAVRERGEVQEWLQFFLTAVRRQADDAITRATALIDLREQWLAVASSSRARLPAVVDLLLANPYVTVGRVQRVLDVTNQGARNLVKEAERRGWIRALAATGPAGRTYWVADRVLDVLQSPPAYDSRPDDGTAATRTP